MEIFKIISELVKLGSKLISKSKEEKIEIKVENLRIEIDVQIYPEGDVEEISQVENNK